MWEYFTTFKVLSLRAKDYGIQKCCIRRKISTSQLKRHANNQQTTPGDTKRRQFSFSMSGRYWFQQNITPTPSNKLLRFELCVFASYATPPLFADRRYQSATNPTNFIQDSNHTRHTRQSGIRNSWSFQWQRRRTEEDSRTNSLEHSRTSN
jgi:hypothetical protein